MLLPAGMVRVSGLLPTGCKMLDTPGVPHAFQVRPPALVCLLGCSLSDHDCLPLCGFGVSQHWQPHCLGVPHLGLPPAPLQLAKHLTAEEMRMVLPRRQLKPRTFRIGAGQVRPGPAAHPASSVVCSSMVRSCVDCSWWAVSPPPPAGHKRMHTAFTWILGGPAASNCIPRFLCAAVLALLCAYCGPSSPAQTVMIGGLARIDVVGCPGATLYLSVFVSDEIGCHLGKTEGADARWVN